MRNWREVVSTQEAILARDFDGYWTIGTWQNEETGKWHGQVEHEADDNFTDGPTEYEGARKGYDTEDKARAAVRDIYMSKYYREDEHKLWHVK